MNINIFNSEQSKTYLPLLLPAVVGIAIFMLSKDSTFVIVIGIIIAIITIVASLMTFKLIEDHNKLLEENEALKNKIHDNAVFVDIATSANIPKFIINSEANHIGPTSTIKTTTPTNPPNKLWKCS